MNKYCYNNKDFQDVCSESIQGEDCHIDSSNCWFNCDYGRSEQIKYGHLDTECEDTILCPYCGEDYSEGGCWVLGAGFEHDGDTCILTCSSCKKEFSVALEIQYLFSTEKIKNENV
jgi:hypothetical protein